MAQDENTSDVPLVAPVAECRHCDGTIRLRNGLWRHAISGKVSSHVGKPHRAEPKPEVGSEQ